MADKRFGVRELIVLGSGTPTITSPGDLNINSDTLGISTNITIGGKIGLGGANYGSSGQVLTSGGSNAAPTWQNASGGGGSGISSDRIFEGNTSAEVVDTGTNGHFKVITEGTERLRVTHSGNVGIGTTVPVEAVDYSSLSLVNTSGAQIELKRTSNNTRHYIYSDEDDNLVVAGNYSGTGPGDLVFTVGGEYSVSDPRNERLRITAGGNIGIGSTQPTVKLDVNGKVALGSSVYDSNGNTGTGGQVLSSIPGIGVSWTDQTGGGSSGGSSDPVGTIVAWAGSAATIPSEYQLCDGSAASTSALQAITGANVPDLRDRFIVGANDVSGTGTYPGVGVGSTGGQANAIIPEHTHPTSVDTGRLFHQGGSPNTIGYGGAGSYPGTVFSMSNPTGSESVANKNLPPYYALCYIIKHTATSGGGGGTGTTKIAVLSEEQSSGTDGGGFTNNAWRDRTLNTEVDQQSFVTFSSSNNYFTLDSGTYKINWSAPAHAVDRHQSKLLYADNASFTSSSEKLGSSEACYDPITEGNSLVQTRSFGETVITITETTYFKIQHRCTDTKSTTGFGVASNFGVDEVYTQVVIQDLNSGGGSGGGGGTGTLTDVDVKQYSDSNTPRTEYGCSNPIEVTVTAGIATIGIGSTSNAYGKKYIQTTEPTTDVCDGDIWYDTTPGSGGGSGTGTLTDVDVKQYSDSNTPRTEYACSNPIEVTVTAGIATIGIGSTSNAYGEKYVQDSEPATSCDGDIWYDTTLPAGSGNSGITIANQSVNLATLATKLDFVGNGVVASGTGSTKTITINNPTISVKDYGAVGDGSTDDTTAIQACFDAVDAMATGANIVFPPGTYKVTDVLKLPFPGYITLIGSGAKIMSYVEEGVAGTFTGDMSVLTGVPATVTISAGGATYGATGTNVATSGGTGSNLTVDFTSTGGVVDGVTINTAGTGYTVGDTITITGGGNNATFTIATVTGQITNCSDASKLVVGATVSLTSGGSSVTLGNNVRVIRIDGTLTVVSTAEYDVGDTIKGITNNDAGISGSGYKATITEIINGTTLKVTIGTNQGGVLTPGEKICTKCGKPDEVTTIFNSGTYVAILNSSFGGSGSATGATFSVSGYGKPTLAYQGSGDTASVVIDGLSFDGTNVGTNGDCIWANPKGTGFIIKNCVFKKFRHHFVHHDPYSPTSTPQGANTHILESEFRQSTDSSVIWTRLDAGMIRNCLFKSNEGIGIEIGQTVDSSDPISFNNFNVSNNYFGGYNFTTGAAIVGKIESGQSSGMIIDGCLIEDNWKGGIRTYSARSIIVNADFEVNGAIRTTVNVTSGTFATGDSLSSGGTVVSFSGNKLIIARKGDFTVGDTLTGPSGSATITALFPYYWQCDLTGNDRQGGGFNCTIGRATRFTGMVPHIITSGSTLLQCDIKETHKPAAPGVINTLRGTIVDARQVSWGQDTGSTGNRYGQGDIYASDYPSSGNLYPGGIMVDDPVTFNFRDLDGNGADGNIFGPVFNLKDYMVAFLSGAITDQNTKSPSATAALLVKNNSDNTRLGDGWTPSTGANTWTPTQKPNLTSINVVAYYDKEKDSGYNDTDNYSLAVRNDGGTGNNLTGFVQVVICFIQTP